MSTSTLEPPAVSDEGDSTSQDQEGISQIVSFRLSNEEYGVDIMHVQEIILIGQITLMPQVPEYVSGLINLRGHVIPIIDLRVRFGLEATDYTEHSRIIVLNVNKKTVGIIVDAVDEVLRINQDQIESASVGLTGFGKEYVSGLVKFEKKLLILMNIEKIIVESATSKE